MKNIKTLSTADCSHNSHKNVWRQKASPLGLSPPVNRAPLRAICAVTASIKNGINARGTFQPRPRFSAVFFKIPQHTFFERLRLEITEHLHGVVNHSDTLASSFSISNLHLFKWLLCGEGWHCIIHQKMFHLRRRASIIWIIREQPRSWLRAGDVRQEAVESFHPGNEKFQMWNHLADELNLLLHA